MLTSPSRTLPGRNPRFRGFLIASTFSLIGSNVFDIAIPLYVLERSGSVIDLSLVVLSLHLPHLLTAPIIGYLSDHNRKRRSLILADLGQVFFLLLLAAYDFFGGQSLWPIFALVFSIKSLMLTFETISQFQMIPVLAGPGELTSGNTWFLSLHRIIQIVGPLTGGFLLHFFGIQSCIWINVLSFASTLYFYWTFKNLDSLLSHESDRAERRLSATDLFRRFKSSLEFIWRSPVFHPFILLMFLWNLSSFTLNSPSLTYYFTVTHGFTAAQYGLIISAFGIVGIFGFMLSPHLYNRGSFSKVFVGSSFYQAVFGSLCLLFLGAPFIVGALYGLSRAGSSALSMGSYVIRQTRVPKDQNGAINASLRMFFMAAAPLSSLLQGWIIHRFGVGVSLFLGALCLWGTWYYSKALSRAWKEDHPAISDRLSA